MIATAPTVDTHLHRDMGAAPAAPFPSLPVQTPGHSPVLWAERPQADRLAIAYQKGQAWALEPLYEAVRPIIAHGLRAARMRSLSLGLPLCLEHADLEQQAWCILADLVLLWRPEQGAFSAYVRVSLPWALAHYVKANSHARRSARVTVESLPHALAADLAAATMGDDGRDYADSLAWAELLAALPERQRAVLVLTAVEGLNLAVVARRLGITRESAVRVRARARRAGSRWERHGVLPSPRPGAPEATERLLRVLVAHWREWDALPGRAIAFRMAGISQRAYTAAMAELVAAGVVAGRSERRPGRLVWPVAERLLRDLEGGERA